LVRKEYCMGLAFHILHFPLCCIRYIYL
ncbi:uncharacterized protein METZ01_LOCUS488508, partial [marine metagenome]